MAREGAGRVEGNGGGGAGRVFSQRRERSQVSRVVRTLGGRGGRGRVVVDIVCEGEGDVSLLFEWI